MNCAAVNKFSGFSHMFLPKSVRFQKVVRIWRLERKDTGQNQDELTHMDQHLAGTRQWQEKNTGPLNLWRKLNAIISAFTTTTRTQRNLKSDVKQFVQGPRFKLGHVAVVDPMHFRVEFSVENW